MSDEDKQPLTYELQITEGGYRRSSTQIKAIPSYLAAKPEGEIQWPNVLHEDTRVEINWSCGGTRFDIEKARAFFNAGLMICDAMEARLKEGPPMEESNED